MADGTKIEWTDATWNPITGCTLVSEGCRHCYAATLAATRLRTHPSRAGLARINAAGEAKFTGEVRFNEQWLDQPLRWRRPRRIFVCAHGDLFHEAVPDEWIDRVFAVMARASQHVFQVLTKRPERMREWISICRDSKVEHLRAAARASRVADVETLHWPLRNVWLGVSVEDQAAADARIPILLETPAAIRFVSYEPALGPVAFSALDVGSRKEDQLDALTGERTAKATGCIVAEGPSLDWIIAGGESGPGARPMHPDWARSLRDQCAAAGVAFLFKQWGSWLPECQDPAGRWDWPDAAERGALHFWHDDREHSTSMHLPKAAAGRLLDGRTHDAFPGAAADA